MTATMQLLAPAKINLFLHVTGQRSDGYHLLQTVFQLIDLSDEVTLHKTEDGQITRLSGAQNIPAEQDLVIRAAKLLQSKTQTNFGCTIELKKKIPMGAGLGGGSSDAASVLWGLNELWETGFRRQELMTLGLELGADVPFFLLGKNAFAEGIGEVLHPLELTEKTVFVIYPQTHIPTVDVFKSPDLTRNHPTVTISDFIESPIQEQFGCNDCEKVVVQKYQAVADAIKKHVEIEKIDTGGIGGTLAGNILALAAMRATLTDVLTEANFAKMIELGDRWSDGVDAAIKEFDLDWHCNRLGARGEYIFKGKAPRTGKEAADSGDFALEQYIHLRLLNDGFLLTPFHNMALMCPDTTAADVDAHTAAFRAMCADLTA